jgi:hypothetical protein
MYRDDRPAVQALRRAVHKEQKGFQRHSDRLSRYSPTRCMSNRILVILNILLIISVWCAVFAALGWKYRYESCHTFPHTSEQIQAPPYLFPVPPPEPIKMWKCHQLVTCPSSDWRFTKPEDVCTYVDDIETSVYDPATSHASYGAHCQEIDVKG